MENRNPIQSAERIFLILETLTKYKSIGLMELSNKVGLHKSTVHRMLLSLIFMGYVKQDDITGRYSPTFKIVEMAGRILARIDESTIIHPYIERLSEICGETVHLVQRSGNQVIYIDKVEPLYNEENSIRMASRIGLARPMYCSAVGKAIMAQLSMAEVKEIWDNSSIEKKTEYTITSYYEMLKELEEIRKNGYAVDNEENELGVKCIAVCLINYMGKVEYAISISAPVSRMTDERVKEFSSIVLETKEKICSALGYNTV